MSERKEKEKAREQVAEQITSRRQSCQDEETLGHIEHWCAQLVHTTEDRHQISELLTSALQWHTSDKSKKKWWWLQAKEQSCLGKDEGDAEKTCKQPAEQTNCRPA